MENTNIVLFKPRVKIIFFLIVLVLIIYLVRFGILTIGDSNRLVRNLVIMNRTPVSFVELSNQVIELQKITSNIDNYSLNDIKKNLLLTASFADLAGREFKAQYESWILVKNQIEKDTSSFVQLKQQLDEVQKLQNDEVVRLKKLLDETTKPSMFSSSMNLIASFILGVLSSVLASHIYVMWQQRKQNLNCIDKKSDYL